MRCLVTALSLLGTMGAAQAVDLNFSGTLNGVCTLGVPVPGTLGLAMDGLAIGSQEPGGTAASVTIVTLGTNKITVTPPAWVTTPGGYVPGAEVREVAYAGLSGLGDLVLTCSSPQSRNFAFGQALGRGESAAEAGTGRLVEGMFTAQALIELARARNVDMPIADCVERRSQIGADRREQSDLEQRLAQLDPALWPEDALEARGGVDPARLGLKQLAVEAKAAQPRLAGDGGDNHHAEQRRQRRSQPPTRLGERPEGGEILHIAAVEVETCRHHRAARAHQRGAEQREPAASGEHAQRRRELAGLEDRAVVGGLALALLGWRFCLFAEFLRHQPNTRFCAALSPSLTMTSM